MPRVSPGTGYVDYGDNLSPPQADTTGGGGGTTITTQDEGTPLSTTVTTLNFTGNAVTASGASNVTQVDVNAVTSVASADGSVTVTNGTTTPDLSVNTSGTTPAVAPSWSTKRIRAWEWYANSSTPNLVGTPIPSAIGAPTQTPVNPTAGFFAQYSMSRLNSSTTIGTATGVTGVNYFWRGSGTNQGGFFVFVSFGFILLPAAPRIVMGLKAAAASGTVEPSTAVDCAFFGADSTDSNLQLMYNDSSGTCTKIDLGASFAVAVNVIYRGALYCAPNDSQITYFASATTNAGAMSTASGTINTNLPTSSTFIGAQMWAAPTSAASIQIVPIRMYSETPGY